MKLLIKSDDYGFTRAVTDGIIQGVSQRMITCTGLFSNMPASLYAAERIKDYPDCCLGQDINIVAGYPVAEANLIPHMVQPDGKFLDAQMHRALDSELESKDHLVLEECLIEVEAQVARFIELTGKKPEYLQGHSYGTKTLEEAFRIVAAKYGIPLGSYLHERFQVHRSQYSWNKKPFSMEEQLQADPLDWIISGKMGLLDHDVSIIGTHCGFLDEDVFRNSTYTIVRMKDLDAVCSKKLKKWIRDNNIELVSYRDLLNAESEGK